MTFVVKIKEISFLVLRDLKCPQPQEGNIQRSQGVRLYTPLNAIFNIKAPPP
jgi:hypothetical protein